MCAKKIRVKDIVEVVSPNGDRFFIVLILRDVEEP